MATQSYIGRGTIYLREIGASAGLISVGNTSNLELSFNEDKKELQDYENSGGGVVDSQSSISSVTASITNHSFSAENLAIALRGLIASQAQGVAVSAEAHTGYKGAFIKFDKTPDKAEAITVTGSGGTPTYVEGTDYEIKTAGIVVLAAGSITDGLALEIGYTTAESITVEGIASSAKDYEMVFDGLNDARSGKAVTVTAHRVKISPTQGLSLIGDDYAEMEINFDLVKDETITGADKSKYVQIQIAQ